MLAICSLHSTDSLCVLTSGQLKPGELNNLCGDVRKGPLLWALASESLAQTGSHAGVPAPYDSRVS